MRRLLDTNICIALINGRERTAADRLLSLPRDQVVLCAMVKAELIYGARRSQRVQDNLHRLKEFFGTFASLPFDDVAAEHCGVIRAHLDIAGTPIGNNDLVIAATALAHDLILVTRNEDEFQRVPGLAVEIW